RQRKEGLASKRLQPAAGVARAVTQYCAAHGVGDARLEFLEAGILAADTLSGGETDAAVGVAERIDHRRQEGRAGLKIPAQRRAERAARRPHPRAPRRRLPARGGMPELAQVAPPRHFRAQLLARRVGRTVIDEDDLVREAAVERARNLVDERA